MVTEILLGFISIILFFGLATALSILGRLTQNQKQTNHNILDEKLNKILILAATAHQGQQQLVQNQQQLMNNLVVSRPDSPGTILMSEDGRHIASNLKELMQKMEQDPEQPGEKQFDSFKEALEAEIDDDDDDEEEDAD